MITKEKSNMVIDWVDIAVTILTTGFFALIGFVWKFSHKVTSLEQNVQDNKKRVQKMESDHDKVMDRLFSMNKQRSEFLTRSSYREDSKEVKDALRRLHEGE
tara:strand:- start:252 stop:557 length:306 start_codon:yes stop_codon:yes gene_type:complete